MNWISIDNELPEEGLEVLVFSPNYIHPDFNEGGITVGFMQENNWIIAVWDGCQDSWNTYNTDEDNENCQYTPTAWMHKPKPDFDYDQHFKDKWL